MTLKILAFTLVLAAVPRSSHAEAVDVSVSGRQLLGKGLPAVQVHIQERIAGFELLLKRNDGVEVNVRGGGAPGTTRTIELPQPEGHFHYEGELKVNFPNAETASMPLGFDTELFGPLRMTLEKQDVDVVNRKVVFRLNRPAAKAKVTVVMDTGKTALDGEILFNNESAGSPLEISWPEAPGRVLRISIQAYDASTFFTGVEIFPWQIDIPHEEVNFDSGKWDIRKEEQAKLEKSFGLISDAATKFGKLADIKLFIAGHTDSVGDQKSNRVLSVNRAQSIGQFLRKRGLKIPILYEGFGEEALLVSTRDEQAEPKNRRAEYIIAVENPSLQNPPFSPVWKKL